LIDEGRGAFAVREPRQAHHAIEIVDTNVRAEPSDQLFLRVVEILEPLAAL